MREARSGLQGEQLGHVPQRASLGPAVIRTVCSPNIDEHRSSRHCLVFIAVLLLSASLADADCDALATF